MVEIGITAILIYIHMENRLVGTPAVLVELLLLALGSKKVVVGWLMHYLVHHPDVPLVECILHHLGLYIEILAGIVVPEWVALDVVQDLGVQAAAVCNPHTLLILLLEGGDVGVGVRHICSAAVGTKCRTGSREGENKFTGVFELLGYIIIIATRTSL